MDALSSLKMMMPQGVGASPLNPDQAAGAVKPIPLQELQKLGGPVEIPQSIDATSGSSGSGFQNLLGNFVNEVAQKQTAASDAVNGLLSGKNVSLHQAMISMEEASVSFQMMVEVRNKLLDSYQELMRMQI